MASEKCPTFTTDDVDPAEGFAYWREVICAVYVQLRAERVNDNAFYGNVQVRQWNSVTISRVAAGGQLVIHPDSDPREECLMSLQLTGTGLISQAGREAFLRPGDFSIYDATRPYQLSFDAPFSQIVVQFPRHLLVERNINIEESVATRAARGSGLTDVVTSLATAMDTQKHPLPSEMRMHLGIQMVDCLASALSINGFGRPPASSQHSARQRLILDYVVDHLHDLDLSVTKVANALGFSTRTLQQLFSDGPGLSARIRSLRLEQASDALINPLLAHHSIARIGADYGFGDPATFARAFRREFGHSPSEARSRGQAAEPDLASHIA